MGDFVFNTIGMQLGRLAEINGGAVALQESENSVTYAALDALTDQAAAGFLAYGLKPGSHAALLGEPDITLMITFYALQKAGIVTFLMNTCLKPQEIAEQVRQADCDNLIIGRSFRDTDLLKTLENEAADRIGSLQHVFYLAGQDCDHHIGFKEVMNCGLSARAKRLFAEAESQIEVRKPALLLATSGTTGGSKLVVLSMFHLVNGGLAKAELLGITKHDVICCAMPLFHIFCIDVNAMAALMAGACLYLPESRRSRVLLSAVEQARCTVLSSVPSIFYSLIARLEKESFDISSLRTGMIGGAYCPPERFCRIEEKLGFTMVSGLGQTECAAGISATQAADPLELRSTSVGRIVEHMEGKIIDPETGEELPPETCGELCVRGRMLMMGYYKSEAKTKETIDADGWMHTGDIGYFDRRGNLFLTARIKDMINRGGEKINANEVERAIMMDDRIKACKVVPVPDAHFGEQVCAVIETGGTETVSEEEIHARIKNKLADYKLPKYYVFISFLPRTATGKFQQKEIIQIAMEHIGLS